MLRGIISGAPWPYQSVTATGTTAGTAKLLSARVSLVVTAVGQTGVKLPPATGGEWFVVYNEQTPSAVVHPSGSDEFVVGGATFATETIAIGTSVLFIANGNGLWMVFRSA